ncbi:MAG: dihydroorotate dehydrogenase-like protein [Bacteroidetes bacterium]|jgi:dihydroorotate dehydrogenase (fumarate)|nr:dihydroorotate dehydrogenase-like protein [Bacteroidota bacterium]
MDLTVKYMGLTLKNPLIVGASTLTEKIKNIQEIEEHGAGAIVLRSLFEEQIVEEINGSLEPNDMYYWYPAAADLIKSITKNQKAESYLKFIEEAKKKTDIPVFASVNCVTNRDWVIFSKQIEDAGADGLELNISTIMPNMADMDSQQVIDNATAIVENVRYNVNIPIAAKVNATPSAQIKMAKSLEQAGANALVLFNRPYQPDIDIDTFTIVANKYLSAPEEMLNTLRWVGILSKHVTCDISATTGIHDHAGVIKQILAGATTAQICSTLFINGISYISTIMGEFEKWMKQKNLKSVADFKGKAIENNKINAQFERIQYLERDFKS